MFNPEDKNIFEYHNGEARRFGDPIAINCRLSLALGGNLPKFIADYRSDDPALADVATERLVEAVRRAFEMVPWDSDSGLGATWSLCLDTLRDFLVWQEKKNLTTATSPMCAPPSESVSVAA